MRPYLLRPSPSLWATVPLLLSGACESVEEPADEAQTWTTEVEFEIGDALEGDALFGVVSQVRVEGARVFVLEPYEARLTLWAPTGTRLVTVGRWGEGPGEFRVPHRVHVDSMSFYVQDQRRFTRFAADGALLETVPDLPSTLSFRGFRLRAEALLDGGYLATPVIPPGVVEGWHGDDPVLDLPVFHAAQDQGQWLMDTVVVLDMTNQGLNIQGDDPESGVVGFFSVQAYGDYDLSYYDPRTGAVVVARRNGEGGQVVLSEVTVAGDTTWHRRLSLPVVPMDPARAEELVETLTRLVHRRAALESEFLSEARARRMVEEAVYLPDPVPGVSRMVGTTSGDIWLRTFEKVDTLAVWYAIGRGDTTSPAKRVLLPTGFAMYDGTATHVWGVREDSLDINYVVGRKLVRAPNEDPDPSR